MRLDSAARTAFLAAHPEWRLEGETISRTFVLRDFKQAMGFVTEVALAAEVANHHPDISISYKTVTLALSTHEAGAFTEKDTHLATQIDTFV